jgi:preprotein translocase SecE subunit
MSKIVEFFREVREVFHNIAWGKKEALIQLTVVVISISIITSLILGGFDFIFTNSFNLLTSLKNPPAVQITPTTATPSAITASPSAANKK